MQNNYSYNDIEDLLNKFTTKKNNRFSKLGFKDELEKFSSKIQKIKDYPELNKYVITLKNNTELIVEYYPVNRLESFISLSNISKKELD